MADDYYIVRAKTPHSLSWEVYSRGQFPRVLSDIIDDCAPGPLKAFLETQQDVSWGVGAENDPRAKNPAFRVYAVALPFENNAWPVAVYFVEGSDENMIVVDNDGSHDTKAYVTLEYAHSDGR